MSYSEYCEGYNKAMAEIGVELDRLRSEKAELLKALADLYYDDDKVAQEQAWLLIDHAQLAKAANETEG